MTVIRSLAGILLTVLLSFPSFSCTTREPAPDVKRQDGWITTPSGLTYQVVETGTGPAAATGQLALIHETTQLADGKMIADTWEMNHPIHFLLGGNQVIAGMEEAVTGMRVGERRKLIVPPSLSKRSTYPEDGSYGPEDTLYYNVILLQTSEQ